MARFSLIVNPTAGHGRSLQALPRVTAALDAAGASYQVRESSSLEHATRLATQAADADQVVVAVGGDGMAGGLAGAVSGRGATYGLIPTGRGNDMATVLGIPFDPAAAARTLTAGSTRQVDLIGVSTPGAPEAVVFGSVYLGIPSLAGEIANRTRWLKGSMVYTVGALQAVATWKPTRFEVTGSDGRHEFAGYAVVVANSAYFGAGMKVAPPALIDDGILDLVLMRHGPKLSLVRALSKLKNGSHAGLREVSFQRSCEVTLTVDRPMPAAADGETLSFGAPLPAGTELRIRVLPRALTVIAPPAPPAPPAPVSGQPAA